MRVLNRSKSIRAIAIASTIAVGAAACGGPTDVATTDAASAAAAPTSAAPTEVPPADTATQDAEVTASATATPSEAPAQPTPEPTLEPAAEPAELRPTIESLDPAEAINNAETNIANLAAADMVETVFDIEVLAVADGSIQTVRDVVTGDRPVLLWFFSPH